MNQSKIHRLLGLVMLLPLLAWAITGVIFLTKPGYEGAYEKLFIKTYDIESDLDVSPHKGWEEIKFIKSVIGLHFLVKTNGSFKQYDLKTLSPSEAPTELQVKQLISDAIQVNTERYGVIDRVEGFKAYTSTGILIQLDWDEMTLSQRGMDRKVIETLYEIHYLQWTKWDGVNFVLGVVGLFCLVSLTIIGFGLYISKTRKKA